MSSGPYGPIFCSLAVTCLPSLIKYVNFLGKVSNQSKESSRPNDLVDGWRLLTALNKIFSNNVISYVYVHLTFIVGIYRHDLWSWWTHEKDFGNSSRG